jgi:hypothetical protein
MAWWNQIFKRKTRPSLYGLEYEVAFKLYSKDGKREVEVREFSNGETYMVEREWVEGTTFNDRHEGRMVGRFASPEDAEKFIVATAWFGGREE